MRISVEVGSLKERHLSLESFCIAMNLAAQLDVHILEELQIILLTECSFCRRSNLFYEPDAKRKTCCELSVFDKALYV